MFRTSSLLLVAACLLGALTAQPAAASVTFLNTTDRFGLNYNISADAPAGFIRIGFGGNTNGAPSAGVHVEVFTGLGGTGSNVFSGTLNTLWDTDFTQADMLDGIFSAVVSFTGAQLPLAGPPGDPPSLLLSLRARGRDTTFVGTSYRDEISTFQPASTTPSVDVPEPGTLSLLALAGLGLMATRRRPALRAARPVNAV